MPELPEVETTRLGITPHLLGQEITEIIIRRHDLRWPITPTIPELQGHTFTAIHRRSKYLILETSNHQALLIHLGMSGSLRIISPAETWKKHDHLAITLSNKLQLRYHDPRRFGLILETPTATLPTHKLLKNLGPEPLEETFTPQHLRTALQNKTSPIKTAIMDAKTVVGIGNIYASESLFRSGIHPTLPANKLTKPKATRLVSAIKKVLQESIDQGGTTLKDFRNSDNQPGYFKQRLNVYGRKDLPCHHCQTPITHTLQSKRATYHCKTCQKK